MLYNVMDYYKFLSENLYVAYLPEFSSEGCRFYKMLPEYGDGSVRILDFHSSFLIVIADFTPKYTFEKITKFDQEFIEISQFETDTSSFKIRGKSICQVDKGICCYSNNRKTAYAFCEAGKATRFTKLIITGEYFERFIKNKYKDCENISSSSLDFLMQNSNSPELNFVFQQIRDCPVEGAPRNLYMEGKVLEILSLLTHRLEQTRNMSHIPVKLDKKDRRSLSKAVRLMKNDLSAYPSIENLAKTACMSISRFQMAFRQVYGTTAYNYLKVMRINYALLLLQNSDDNISAVAKKVGYKNSGHFSKLFHETFGVSPKQYRNIHRIK